MDEQSNRWHELTPSAYRHERAGLAHVRELLPDRHPYQAWSNFTFISQQGHLREVDMLVATPSGLYLVEIKSFRGRVSSRYGTWETKSGRTFDNPLILADQKAKELKALLKAQAGKEKIPVPFLGAAVFLSEAGMECALEDSQRHHIYGPNGTRNGLPQIGTHLLTAAPTQTPPDPRFFIALDRLLKQIGIKPSQRMLTVGQWKIESRPYESGPTWQDYHATRTDMEGEYRRVRIYLYERESDGDKQRSIMDAAKREFRACQGLRHPGLLRPSELESHPRGPALIIEQPKDALRLDHYMAKHQDALDLPTRVDLFRQLAETAQYAHARRLVHRALSPRAVLVEPTGDDWTRPILRVGEWQAAARGLSGAPTVHRLVPSSGAVQHIEPAAEPYLAPEFTSAPDGTVAMDVFGLGAIGYLIFTGQPPAADRAELQTRLQVEGGLHPSAVVDGIPDDLLAMIAMCTAPVVKDRFVDVDEVIEELDKALSVPDSERAEVKDPWDAAEGNLLADTDYEVRRVLGTGATARAFLVSRDGMDSVLKIARSADAELRLLDEQSVLEDLRHDHLVVLRRGVFPVGSRHAIEIDYAGDRSLAQLLRNDGALLPDQLQRFGDQLLDVVAYLERKSVFHRDIKPDNLGIKEHLKQGSKLVLFDFSLAGAPATDVVAGTRGYIDPFLGDARRPEYDSHAERYAAAVTLHEMASLELPTWGLDGTDPSFVEKVSVSSELFAAPLRPQLVAFFERAFQKDIDRRYQSAVAMREAWREAFDAIDETGPATNSRLQSDDPEELRDEAAAEATLDTALDAAGLTLRAVAVAQRLGASTVGDLIDIPYRTLWNARGLSKRTRQELVNRHTQWRRELLHGEGTEAVVASGDVAAAPLDVIAAKLLPKPRRREDTQVEITHLLLGLAGKKGKLPESRWPTNVTVAKDTGLSQGRIAQVLAARRKAWSRDRDLDQLHDELVDALRSLRRVASAEELAERLLGLHGCSDAAPAEHRMAYAYAVLRALIERDSLAEEPRFAMRRHADRVLVALQVGRDEPMDTVSDNVLLDLAAGLADAALDLAYRDPFPTPTAVIRRLQDLAKTVDWVWGERRLVRLAASATGSVLSNARLELYPRDLSLVRALRLAQAGAGLPSGGLTAKELKLRVTNRFPGLAPLPDGEALRDLFREAGFEVNWDGERFKARQPETTEVPAPLVSVISPIVVEGSASADVPARLLKAVKHGGLRIITMRPKRLARARREVQAILSEPVIDVSEAFVRALRSEADRVRIPDFGRVLHADVAESGSRDQLNLHRLLTRAFDALKQQWAGRKVLVLDNLTPFGRYSQGLALLNTLTEHARYGRSPDGPDTLILLCPAADERQHPHIGSTVLHRETPEEWVVATSTWLDRTGAA